MIKIINKSNPTSFLSPNPCVPPRPVGLHGLSGSADHLYFFVPISHQNSKNVKQPPDLTRCDRCRFNSFWIFGPRLERASAPTRLTRDSEEWQQASFLHYLRGERENFFSFFHPSSPSPPYVDIHELKSPSAPGVACLLNCGRSRLDERVRFSFTEGPPIIY